MARRSVFIVEDHPIFREGLVQILKGEPDLTVAGQASNAEAAMADILRLKPDLVLVDISLPGKSGLDLIRDLRAASLDVKLLVVSMHDEALYADRVLRLGANGYIMKQEGPEELVLAIRDVLSGHLYVTEKVLGAGGKARPAGKPEATNRRFEQLTDTELEILELVGRGRSNQEIARQLQLNAGTVPAHCRQIKKKLGLKTAHQLIRYAVCWLETGAT